MKTSAVAGRTPAPIRYRIEPIRPEAHLFEVTLEIAAPDPLGQKLALPVWIPGSYLVREFAKHIVRLEVRDERPRSKLQVAKLDKNTWAAGPATGALVVVYQVYAWDLSVRAAHLDTQHGFFNGTSVFLRVVGQEHVPHEVEIVAPRGPAFRDWRVATTLPEHGAKRHGFGRYRAKDYDALVDHPVEMGVFELLRFKACGVPHEVAITGRVPKLDAQRVCADLQKICEAQIRLFEPDSASAPFQRYLFLVMVLGEGYGGLEHRSSTALICSRESLPAATGRDPGESYGSFLGLASHEYFHSWNIKRIKPARFAPYDFDRENYTSLLWIFEGFTSYYDDLVLVRTGLVSEQHYLESLAKTITEVEGARGRLRQSLAESSHDAWIKYYRQDENSPNAIVSYYKKGALVGLGLDLLIRSASRGRRSLDDVMRVLWVRFGRDFFPRGAHGLGEDEFAGLVAESTGVDVARELRHWAYGTADVPLAALFKPFGIALRTGSDAAHLARPTLGVRVAAEGSAARLATVFDDSPAQRAGLSAGDVLVALEGLRITPGNLDVLLERYRLGEKVRIHAFRRDELIEAELILYAGPPVQWKLSFEPGPKRLRQAWLGAS